MTANPGDVLAGNYRVVRRLGEGWGGVAYEVELIDGALERPAGTRLALKVYKPEVFAADPHLIDRVRREAETGKRLDHPNVLKIHALEEFRDGGRNVMALVMDLCTAGDLSHHIAAHFPYDEESLKRLMTQLAAGVRALHDAGLLHRDVKPQNILMGDDGVPRLGDFGVVRHKDDLTMTSSGQFLGTIRYSAQEYLFGTDYDGKSDVYSLGAVFFELLYGKPVYAEHSRFSNLVAAIRSDAVSFPRAADRFRATPTPTHIIGEALAQAMLERDAAKRPTIRDVLRSLAAGTRRGAARRRLQKRLATMIHEEFDGVAPVGRHFVFHSYTGRLLLDALSDADLVRLLTSDPASVLRSDAYLPIATAAAPGVAKYAAMTPAQRLRLLVDLRTDQRYYLHSSQDTSENYGHLMSFWQFMNNYLDAEQTPRLQRMLRSMRDRLGLDENGQIPMQWS